MMNYPVKIEFNYPHIYCKGPNHTSCDTCNSPYIHLAEFDSDNHLDDADQIVAPGNIVILVDYPLNHTHEFEFSKALPYTRRELAVEICRLYQKIYKDGGMYGIWGHYIDDLDLVEVVLSSVINIDGKSYNVYHLCVDS